MLTSPTVPDTLQGREDFIAKGINGTAPIPMGPYSSMTGAKVNNGTLELDVRLSPTAPTITLDDAFMHGVAFGVCKNSTMSDLIKRGGSLSMVFTNTDGQVLPPATISSCPTS
jgi:hypothetical protein